jgi:CDP-glucose 4,6-dehydratase
LLAGSYNAGPRDVDCLATGKLAELFATAYGEGVSCCVSGDHGPHEAVTLRLDASKIQHTCGVFPVWSVAEAVQRVVEWTKTYAAGGNVAALMDKQIEEFITA